MAFLVNGERVDESAVKDEMERMRPEYERVFAEMDAEEREAQLYDWSRENMVERTLLQQEASKLSLELHLEAINRVYNEFKKEFLRGKAGENKDKLTNSEKKQLKRDAELKLKIDALLDRIYSKIKIPADDEIHAHYKDHLGQFMSPEVVRASHIVKHMRTPEDKKPALDTIQQAREALKNGMSFEDAAAKYSDCPDKGGDLGYFPRGQMVEKFDEIVFGMQVDEVSDVFLTEFGYHIVKLYDHKPSAHKPLDDVKDEITKILLEEKQKTAVEDFVDKLKETAKIEDVA